MQLLRSAAASALLALLLAGCDQPASPPPPPAPVAPPPPAAPVATPTAPNDLSKLKGRWQRPDGGYVIEIKEVLPDGKLTAAYYNPRSINVSQAEARKDAGAVKVFIELRDQNYPGATYNLTFDPEHDVLAGAYFQPLAGETYQVEFQRLKEEGK